MRRSVRRGISNAETLVTINHVNKKSHNLSYIVLFWIVGGWAAQLAQTSLDEAGNIILQGSKESAFHTYFLSV